MLAKTASSPTSHPLLYEINTRCWLWQISERHSSQITLADIPECEFADWRQRGFTHLWLMGVWRVGPRVLAFSRRSPQVREWAARLLPDFTEDDIVGSPYAVASYEVSETVGGEAALQAFRTRLANHGLRLILDFIPNHMGLDHRWLKERPELFVHNRARHPEFFQHQTSKGPLWIAHGKDPYFPAWADTAQLDYRNPATRAAMIEELKSVAQLCDGVRCDMAMLVLNDVFAGNWSKFPCNAADHVGRSEFWSGAIAAIKSLRPDFLFLAEAYWGLEDRLLELGFDFAYDKRLTDDLRGRRPVEAQRHLLSLQSTRSGLSSRTHFLENHDEPRVASLLSFEEHRAAALLVLGLPGMKLLYQGQLSGASIHASVHLRLFPPEAHRAEISTFYDRLLAALQKTAVGRGQAVLLAPRPAWEGNRSAQNIVVVQWQVSSSEFDLVVVNLAPHRAQCYVLPTIAGLENANWELRDLLGTERYERSGAVMKSSGLYLDVAPHAAELFKAVPLRNGQRSF